MVKINKLAKGLTKATKKVTKGVANTAVGVTRKVASTAVGVTRKVTKTAVGVTRKAQSLSGMENYSIFIFLIVAAIVIGALFYIFRPVFMKQREQENFGCDMQEFFDGSGRY